MGAGAMLEGIAACKAKSVIEGGAGAPAGPLDTGKALASWGKDCSGTRASQAAAGIASTLVQAAAPAAVQRSEIKDLDTQCRPPAAFAPAAAFVTAAVDRARLGMGGSKDQPTDQGHACACWAQAQPGPTSRGEAVGGVALGAPAPSLPPYRALTTTSFLSAKVGWLLGSGHLVLK